MDIFLTILLFFIVFSWIMGRIFPYLIKWFIKRKLGSMGGKSAFYTNMQSEQQQKNKDDDGKVTAITIKEEKEKVIEKDMGEYVDFEEKNDDK